MELLNEIFDLKITREFIEICESIARKNPTVINNGLGINYSADEIESVKIYYGFHHRLELEDVKKLHFFGSEKTYLEIEKTLRNSDYDFHPFYPTGVSFALKIDKKLNSAIGHFMMPELKKDDRFFTLEKVKEHFLTKNELPTINRKGIFTLIDKSGLEHQKDYFYVTDKNLKRKIGLDFNVDTDLVPSIEWVLGKGFYSGSKPDDEKIVLQSNYAEVYDKIISKENSKLIRKVNSFMKDELKIYCVCPGYYKNKDIKSYYYFNGQIESPTIINTIQKLQRKFETR